MAMQHTTPHSSPFTLDNLIFLLFRRKWLVLLATVLGLGGAVTMYIVTPPQYVSEAKLLVLYVTDNIAVSTEAAGGVVTRPDNWGANVLNSEVQIIASQIIAEKAVRDVGVENIFPPAEGQEAMPAEAAAVHVLKDLSMEIPYKSNIIRLGYTSHDRFVAQRVLDGIVQEYLKRHQEIHSAAASYDLFTKRAEQLGLELKQTEEELRMLKADLGVVSLEDSLRNRIERLSGLDQRIEEARGQIASRKARVDLLWERLQGDLGGEAESGADREAQVLDPEEEMRQEMARIRLSALRAREQELLSSFTPESAIVRSVRRQIVEAQQQAGFTGRSKEAVLSGTESTDTLRRELVMEQGEIASTQALLDTLTKQEALIRADLDELHANEGQVAELELKRETLRSAYRKFSDALDMAKSNLALAPEHLSNITEVQPATLPVRAMRPELKKRIVMAGGLGAAVPVGLIVLLELFAARAIRRPKDIEEALDLPALISIPFNRRLRGLLKPAGGRPALPGPGGGESGDADEAPFPLDDDAEGYFHALRHRIQAAGVLDGEIPHFIGVTSCTEGAGTTTVAAGLSLSLSQIEEEQVLMIDGNLGAQGVLPRALGIATAGTLPEVMLKGGCPAPVQNRLTFLSAGNGDHRLVRASVGRRFRDVIAQLKEGGYTSVVVDLPPVDDTSQALQMAGLLDGVILVVEAEKVSRERARAVLKMLRNANANVVGVVFNKKRDYVPEWLESAV